MKLTCPFGHTCQTTDTEGNVTERCRLYKMLPCVDLRTNESVEVWDCAIGHQVQIGRDIGQQTKEAGAAIESFRNEMVSQNNQLLNMDTENRKLMQERSR